MTEEFKTDQFGRITSPGKFEGEPLWVPHFWALGLEGCANDDDGESYTFQVTSEDSGRFPELLQFASVKIREDDNGFVYGEPVDFR